MSVDLACQYRYELYIIIYNNQQLCLCSKTVLGMKIYYILIKKEYHSQWLKSNQMSYIILQYNAYSIIPMHYIIIITNIFILQNGLKM